MANIPEKAFYVASYLFNEEGFIFINGMFYKYNNYIWEKQEEEYVMAVVHKTCSADEKIGIISAQLQKEIKSQLSIVTWASYGEDLKNIERKNEVCLKTNILCLDTFKTRPYKRKDFKFSQLPFDYNEDKEKAPNAPRFTLFLNEIMDNDNSESSHELEKEIRFITEWMGYTMLSTNPYHKALIMLGDGRNGKGKLMYIWTKMLGKQNVTEFDLKSLNNPNWAIQTKDKMVNFCPDLKSGQQLDTGTIKSAVSGEMVEGRVLYSNPVTFEFTAKLIILTNELPYLQKVSSAVKERFFVLPFNRLFEGNNQDHNLEKDLNKEVEEVFHIAIGGLKDLLKRGHFIVPKKAKQTQKNFYLENDTVALFLAEEGISDDMTNNKRSLVFHHYKQFCMDWNKSPMGRTKFIDGMNRHKIESIKVHGQHYFSKK